MCKSSKKMHGWLVLMVDKKERIKKMVINQAVEFYSCLLFNYMFLGMIVGGNSWDWIITNNYYSWLVSWHIDHWILSGELLGNMYLILLFGIRLLAIVVFFTQFFNLFGILTK